MEDLKKQFTKDEINTEFERSNKVKVVFTKKDGSERTMICTKDSALIPEQHRPKQGSDSATPAKKTPDHLLSVYDLEAKGWRSFTIAKVISIDPIGEIADEGKTQTES